MKLSRVLFISSFVLFVLLGYRVFLHSIPRTISFNEVPQRINIKSNEHPVGIVIPSIKVWLPLIPSEITNEKWETTVAGVSFWKSGVVPGESGNAILYGHNWGNLLGNLSHVKPGDTIEIYYKDNTKKIFMVSSTQEVDPNNITILNNTKDTRLTIYTCSGFLDLKRFVVVARIV